MGNIWGFRDNGELICDANLKNSKISQNSYLAISGLFSGERSIEVIFNGELRTVRTERRGILFSFYL